MAYLLAQSQRVANAQENTPTTLHNLQISLRILSLEGGFGLFTRANTQPDTLVVARQDPFLELPCLDVVIEGLTTGCVTRSKGTIRVQCLERFILVEKHPPGQLIQKMRPLQTIHDRPLYLGQVKRDPALLETQINRFKTFERARINGVDRRTHQNQMADIGSIMDLLIDHILQKSCIREIQALVHT